MVARSLQEGAIGFRRLKAIDEHGSILGVIDKTLWNGEFEEYVNLTTGLMKFYARHSERHHTVRKLSSNNFLLAVLCEYVKIVTGRCHHREIALLLEGAWTAHGVAMGWTPEILQARLRRLSPSMKTTAVKTARALQTKKYPLRKTSPK